MRPRSSSDEVGKAFKVIAERLRNPDNFKDEPCKTYGCLSCKNYHCTQGYDYEWGRVVFLNYECKKQHRISTMKMRKVNAHILNVVRMN